MPTPRHDAVPDAVRTITFTPAGIAGTIMLGAVIILCLRLGVWQLERRAERTAINTSVAARMEQAPITDIELLTDTTGLTYRVALASGTFDNERYIVLPGRSHRGVPGVHLLMPLRLAARGDAILVNRGWVPAPDAATIVAADFAVEGQVELRGLVLSFPGRAQSLSERARSEARAGEFRHVWFSIDESDLRSQFPYPLLNATLQEIGATDGAQRYPVRLDPPPLDAGPHLGYAIQWFAFALIGVIGWFALVLRARATRVTTAIVVIAGLCAAPDTTHAQLRPLDPLEWRIFDGDAAFIAGAGAGVMWDQPASLAGSKGTLLEAGTYVLALRSGRIAIEVGGTAVWRLTEKDMIATPSPGVAPAGTRREPGGAYVSSALRFSPDDWPADLVLRFGATIPTTSDESGLDRDRTDFFALLSARFRTGPLTLKAENGIGINGTLRHDLPQTDVWTFAFGATYALQPVTLHADLVGRQDGHSYVIRGNEDQREVRAGLDFGRTRWLRMQYIHGLSDFSPAHGVRVSAGFVLDRR